jgi:hypothetical protein
MGVGADGGIAINGKSKVQARLTTKLHQKKIDT